MAYHIDARYINEEQLFLPPMRAIGFNTHLIINDSLLVLSYAEAYDISYPEAAKQIKSEVEELLQCIDNDGFYVLNDIGTLTRNDEANLVFEPFESGILTPDLYGLSSFDMPRLSDAAADVEKTTVSLTPSSFLIADTVAGSAFDSPAAETSVERFVHISKAAFQAFAAAAVAVIAFFLFSVPVAKDNSVVLSSIVPNFIISATPSAQQIAAETPSQAEPSQAEPTETEPTETEPAQPAVNQPADVQPLSGASFVIVLASQVSKRGADIFVDQLKKQGFDDVRVLTKGKMVRVVYGHYLTESKAYNSLHRLRDNKSFSDCWVMKVKNEE